MTTRVAKGRNFGCGPVTSLTPQLLVRQTCRALSLGAAFLPGTSVLSRALQCSWNRVVLISSVGLSIMQSPDLHVSTCFC